METGLRLLVTIVLLLPSACVAPPQHLNALARRDASRANEIIQLLGINKGDTVADLGAGGGYFTVKLAQATGPSGLVYAVDVIRANLDYLSNYASEAGVSNVKLILTRPGESGLPAGCCDLVFVRDTYHELKDRVRYFSQLRSALTRGGRIAIIDQKGSGSLFSHNIDENTIQEEMRLAGYALIESHSLLQAQSFNIFAPE